MEQSVIYRRLLFFFFKVLCVPHWHLTRNILSTTIFFVQLDFFIQPITELSGDHTATLVLFLQLSLCCWHRVSLLRHLSSMFLDKVRRQESKSCITNKMRKQLSHCVTKYTSSSQLFMARHITFLLFVWVCTCVRQTAGTCVRYSWNWFSPISNSRCFLLRIAEWHKRTNVLFILSIWLPFAVAAFKQRLLNAFYCCCYIIFDRFMASCGYMSDQRLLTWS